MKNVFEKSVSEELIERINSLTSETPKVWGTMDVSQMLAHCNVTYEMLYEDIHPKAKGFKKVILKLLVKPLVVGDKPYKKNNPTAPAFKIQGAKDFEKEKARLIGFINQVQQEGAEAFNNRESNSFGVLNSNEWNAMFYKHLNHHLSQFGA